MKWFLANKHLRYRKGHLKQTSNRRFALTIALFLATSAYAIAEELTLTTYYPSPRGVYEELQVKATNSGNARLTVQTNSNANISSVDFQRARLTPLGVLTDVQLTDKVGEITFSGYDNGSYRDMAAIRAEVDGVVAPISLPSRLVFLTAETIALGNLIERMRIDDGHVIISGDTDLVTYKDVYVGGVGAGPGGFLYIRGRPGNSIAGISVVSPDYSASISLSSDNTGPVTIYSPDASDDLRFKVGGQDRVTITSTGKLGIGVTNPQGVLDVNGPITIRGGAPVAGRVLTATDNVGNAVWSPPAPPVSRVYFPVAVHCPNWCTTCNANPGTYPYPNCPAGFTEASAALGSSSRFSVGSDENQDASDDRPDCQLWVICTNP